MSPSVRLRIVGTSATWDTGSGSSSVMTTNAEALARGCTTFWAISQAARL
jgi:hypothetical protein